MSTVEAQSDRPAVEAIGLSKRYGATHAVRSISFAAPAGSVLGLLGPNGAGKTTMVRLLTTLARPDDGTARIAGFDIRTDPDAVRRRIGVTGQYASLDESLSGTANLRLFARLHGLRRSRARSRAAALLEQFDLSDAADRPVSTYSGGMRRRLDVAASLVSEPAVIFLDEPTTGLDPAARAEVWRVTGQLARAGTTVVLTSQYLDEIDALADSVAVIDRGSLVAIGTPTELKRRVGGHRLLVRPLRPEDLQRIRQIVADVTGAPPGVDDSGAVVAVGYHSSWAGRTLAEAAHTGLEIGELSVRLPSLDDVFHALVGRQHAEDGKR